MADLLVSASELNSLVAAGTCIVVDCRFDLSDPEGGRRMYLEGHVPGARYADLEHDLSAPVTEKSGRHPLPTAPHFSRFLSRIGWLPEVQLIVYDDKSNAMSSRLWWLMRYFGHSAKLLDGGFRAWEAGGFALQSRDVNVTPSEPPRLVTDPSMTVEAVTIESQVIEKGEGNRRLVLLDARAAERYSGEVEPLDTSAGHIPGALNRPFALNLQSNGQFKPAHTLKAEFLDLLGDSDMSAVVHYCGSGVTACHNRVALELAGVTGSRIYPGSWSEWIRDPGRPVKTGD